MFNPPTLEDLQETRRSNEKLVLEALQKDNKPEWVETELAKTTGLALSHLRAALTSLLDQGRVRRLPGTGTRAVYGLADPGLADVPATPLTEAALAVKDYLQGRADSALYMSEQLRMTREEVMAALSLLNAHGQITCTFVGSLVIFRLKEVQALEVSLLENAEHAKEQIKEKEQAKEPTGEKAAIQETEQPTTVAPKASPKARKSTPKKTSLEDDTLDAEVVPATKPKKTSAKVKTAKTDKADKPVKTSRGRKKTE